MRDTDRSALDPFKSAADDACVMDGMPGIAVADVILDQQEIVAPIREGKAAGMPQRVRMVSGNPARLAVAAIR